MPASLQKPVRGVRGSPGQAKRRPGVNVIKRFHSLSPRGEGRGEGVSLETRTKCPVSRLIAELDGNSRRSPAPGKFQKPGAWTSVIDCILRRTAHERTQAISFAHPFWGLRSGPCLGRTAEEWLEDQSEWSTVSSPGNVARAARSNCHSRRAA